MWYNARSSKIEYESDEKTLLVKDMTKGKLSGMVDGKSLVRYRIVATFKKKSPMKANDTHWEVYESAIDESTSTDDIDRHDHGNEVHESKEMEIVELQVLKKQIVTGSLANLSPASLTLDKINIFFFN